MRVASFFLLLGAALVGGCGARTGDDELLGYGASVGVDPAGGTAGVGGWGAGGLGTGAQVGVGGAGGFGAVPATGGVVGAGGAPGGSGGSGGAVSACCQGSASPGCGDPEVQECVCALDPFCCTGSWDSICAQEIESFGCGTCGSVGGAGGVGVGGQSTGGSAGSGDCCFSHGGVGCEDPNIAACVCSFDSFCCNRRWDTRCSEEAREDCGASCEAGGGGFGGFGAGGGIGGAPSTGGTSASGGGISFGSCCEVHDSPYCEDPEVSLCVCESDPFCCANSWDSLCVGGAVTCGLECEMGTGGQEGSCCTTHDSPGCMDPSVTACTCSLVGECCEDAWGQQCVTVAELACAAACDPSGSGGGPAECGLLSDECAACACSSCSSEVVACGADGGCLLIYDCIRTTGCAGLDCLEQETCGGVIDSQGGFLGPSFELALAVASCGLQAGCPCP